MPTKSPKKVRKIGKSIPGITRALLVVSPRARLVARLRLEFVWLLGCSEHDVKTLMLPTGLCQFYSAVESTRHIQNTSRKPEKVARILVESPKTNILILPIF